MLPGNRRVSSLSRKTEIANREIGMEGGVAVSCFHGQSVRVGIMVEVYPVTEYKCSAGFTLFPLQGMVRKQFGA